MKKNKLRLATGLAALFLTTNSIADTSYYLAPTGNDERGNGSASAPWKTLHKAKNAVRNMPKPLAEDINVILADGRYELSSTLVFTAADSGNAKHRVTYKAENPGKVIISGGSVVTGWHDNDKDGIWQASVTPGVKTRELYVAGQTATRARSEDGSGWHRDGHDGLYTAPAEAANWQNQDKIELATTFLWKHYKGPVARIDGTQVTMKPAYWKLAKIGPFGIVDMRAKHVNWVENAFELLDSAGEWYHNESTNILYYKPKADQQLTGKDAVEVVLPKLEKLVSADGASHITFDGLTFAHSSWLGASGDQGYVSIQTGTILDDSHWATIEDAFDGIQEIPGAINLLHTKHLMFKNGAITNVGGNAVLIDRGSQYNTFFNNQVSYVSAASFVVGNPIDSHARPDYLIKGNIIDNNDIFNTGLVFVDTSSIKVNYTEGTVIANNNINNVPYTGVSMGWGWGRYDVENITRGQFGDDEGNKGYNSATVIKDNIVFSNRISNYANKLGDTGGVYNLGASPGMRIVGNLISHGHTPGGGTHFVNGIYLDNGSRGIEVEYNGVYDVVNNNYFYNGNGRYNTLGKNNEFHHLDSDDSNISKKLKATAGRQASITAPRSVADILRAMPQALEPEPLSAMPEFGFLVGKTATASTNSSSAVNAIDGNPRTYWDAGVGNTTGSLIIDTGSNNEFLSFVVAFGKVIDGVETYIRSGMTYQMSVSTDGNNWKKLVTRSEPTFGRSALPHYFDNTMARYIRLDITDSDGQDFGVLRFKAYTPDNVNNATNMAWNGTAKQSSTWQGSAARLANDGSTIGNWKGGEVTHTAPGSQNYWEVDLGEIKDIGEIRIWNRTDCCTKRLRDYHVFISDTPIAGRTVAEVQAQQGMFDYHEPGVAGTTTDIPVDRTGRYVRVQLSNTDAKDKENVLSLAEVQVYRR